MLSRGCSLSSQGEGALCQQYTRRPTEAPRPLAQRRTQAPCQTPLGGRKTHRGVVHHNSSAPSSELPSNAAAARLACMQHRGTLCHNTRSVFLCRRHVTWERRRFNAACFTCGHLKRLVARSGGECTSFVVNGPVLRSRTSGNTFSRVLPRAFGMQRFSREGCP